MTTSDTIRWLFRPLSEPIFLKLYLEEFDTQRSSGGAGCRLFQEAFWALEPDTEHPETFRKAAWNRIENWLEVEGPVEDIWAMDCYRVLLHGLKNELSSEEEKKRDDLVRFWAFPELFRASEDEEPPDNWRDYVEIHAHLRGALPFSDLWNDWLEDARFRASLRSDKTTFIVGHWRKTYAEILGKARLARHYFRDRKSTRLNSSHYS